MSDDAVVHGSRVVTPTFSVVDRELDVVEFLNAEAGPFPQIELAYEADKKLLWITMRPEPKPVLTAVMIDSLRRVQLAAYECWGHDADRPIRFMALRSFNGIFSLGGDLDFILDCLAKNDRAALVDYARIACEAIALSRNGVNGTVLTFAAVRSRIMGGGVDTARGCNFVVAEEQATFSYPEVNFNHYPIAAVPVLARHIGHAAAERILLSCRDHGAAELQALGMLDAVVPAGGSEDWIRNYVSAAMHSQEARVGVIAACNRMAGDFAGQLRESMDAWVKHIFALRPTEIAKLQRIAAAQERMLARLLKAS